MRKTTLSEKEIAEIDEYKRRENRNNGFSMMLIRDRGWVRLKNGVLFQWPVDRPLSEGEARPNIPKGHFLLTIDKKRYLFNADEFGKWLRWV